MRQIRALHIIQEWVAKHPDRSALIALACIAILSRFLFLGHPSSAVFDEVHFNYFAGFYYSGLYFYDIHPPLGKLLIALAALPAGGITPESIVQTISTPYPESSYMAMRALPAGFGTAIPLLLYVVARRLGLAVRFAFIAGAMVALDNAFTIQSRLILLDAMLLGFGLLSLWVFLIARDRQSLPLWCLSAFFAGCSLSVKWIGVSFLGLIGLVIIIDWIRDMLGRGWRSHLFVWGLAYLLIAVITYMLTFAIHFALLPKSHEQGDAFMTPKFRSTLEGSEFYGEEAMVYTFRCPENYRHTLRYTLPKSQVKPAEALACQIDYQPLDTPNFFEKLVELNRTMYATNQGLDKSHPDASPWYSWPLMAKPLYYWYADGARIYLIGNPAVWWLSTLLVLVLLGGQFFRSEWRQNEAFWILVTGFWANLLPFMMVSRVMFMYHYLTTLCFAILIGAYTLQRLRVSTKFCAILFGILAFCFLLLSPITYGSNWFGSDLLWFLRLFGWHP